ncbi:MAG: ATP-dependent RecD-like DNA helicase [Oscillospiraceae bacterium]|jgi:exodeoxyribonuclease V alpha subunit|nr:ATP-dependent RecD-like DNA helicase [Oscillospiraceae bacterium]
MDAKPLQSITGTVEEIVYHNDDTGFTVLLLDDGEELRTVVGQMMDIGEGEDLKATGRFTTHPSYGPQFKAEVVERSLPATSSAILKYLGSRTIKGIGPTLARRLVETFGDDTLEVMEHHPEDLARVEGISRRKAMEIGKEFKRMFGVRTVMLFLSRHGIDPATSIRVWKAYGNYASEMVQANPYILCGEDVGMAFEKVDQIALDMGVEPDSPNRVGAAVAYVLRHNLGNGHTCLPEQALCERAAALLRLDVSAAQRQLVQEEESQNLVSDTFEGRRYYYLPHLYRAETYVAGRLAMMLSLEVPCTGDFGDQIGLLEAQNGVKYAQLQKSAIVQALSRNLFILTGGPGTGKTTTVNAIIELFEQQGSKVALAAPTGRAAKRLSEVTGREAKTIHRLLEVDFKDKPGESLLSRFKRGEKNPISADVVIVDEMSMVDILLFESLVRALRLTARLVMVGDSDQLPSVGPGNVLKDLIDSGCIATVRLTEIFRQAAQSLIVTNAHAVVRGEMPELRRKDGDFFFLQSGSYANTAQLVTDLCSRRLPKSYGYSPLWDIQVMAPNRIGELGTIELNKRMQQVLNPPDPEKKEMVYGPYTFREGDKVMQIKNNYDITWTKEDGEKGTGVYNGDIGLILAIDKPSRVFVVKYDERIVNYTFDNADEIELAFAVTVHKSQGCEFEAVVLPLMNSRSRLYHRNLFYTAVTRARKLLIIIGRPETVQYLVENNRKTLRFTSLARFLTEACGGGNKPEEEQISIGEETPDGGLLEQDGTKAI